MVDEKQTKQTWLKINKITNKTNMEWEVAFEKAAKQSLVIVDEYYSQAFQWGISPSFPTINEIWNELKPETIMLLEDYKFVSFFFFPLFL